MIERALSNNNFFFNYIFDPLEQFELGSFFDLGYSDSYAYFLLSFFTYIVLEKSINFFSYDVSLKSLIKNLIYANLPKDLHYMYFILYPTFLFVFSANISGLFAYGFTETSTIPLVFLLSFFMFFGILFTGIDRKRNFFFNNFLPSGTPASILKLLITIEIISYLTRLISLALRLLANMISGHILLKILISFVWILLTSYSFFSYFFFIPWIIILVILLLEILIAFLQSYVFIFLSIVFIKEII